MKFDRPGHLAKLRRVEYARKESRMRVVLTAMRIWESRARLLKRRSRSPV